MVVATQLLVATPLAASESEFYLAVEAGYRPLSAGEELPAVQAGGLALGAGYHVTDFALLEGMLFYAAGARQGEFHNLFGAELAFRLLIDATQWIPSLGPSLGWAGDYNSDSGLLHGLSAGLSGCLEYRGRRSHSLAICGESAFFPLSDALNGFYGVAFRLNGFLPYLFE